MNWDVAEELRWSLSISTDTQIPSKYETLFCEATKIVAKHGVTPKPITVFFVRDVLQVHLTIQDRIAEYWRDVSYHADL